MKGHDHRKSKCVNFATCGKRITWKDGMGVVYEEPHTKDKDGNILCLECAKESFMGGRFESLTCIVVEGAGKIKNEKE